MSSLARCEVCDGAIRQQGNRWVHLAAQPEHTASPAEAPNPAPLAVEVYRGREFLRVCRQGVPDAMDFVRRVEGASAYVRLARNRTRIEVWYGPRPGAVYDLLPVSTREAVET
jgi:hypothetical protein